jgi:voltage-dependent anion channel protein 2
MEQYASTKKSPIKSFTAYTSTRLAFTSTGIEKGEIFLKDLNAQLNNNNITTNIKVDISSN